MKLLYRANIKTSRLELHTINNQWSSPFAEPHIFYHSYSVVTNHQMLPADIVTAKNRFRWGMAGGPMSLAIWPSIFRLLGHWPMRQKF